MPGQVWGTSALGGNLAMGRMSHKMRMFSVDACTWRQFVTIETEFGAGEGDTHNFRKISRIQTAGGTITETQKIPVSNFLVYTDSATVAEYGNSIEWTGKLQLLSEVDIEDPTIKVLRDDMVDVLDAAAGATFQATDVYYTPTGTVAAPTSTFSYTGVVGGAATRNLQVFDVEEIHDRMERENVPYFDGENYMMVASILALRGIMRDDDWEDMIRYGDPERAFKGEIGRVMGMRFTKENNVLSKTALTGGLGEAIVLGDDAVFEIVALPEHMREKEPTEYQRVFGLAWYAILAFKQAWDYTTEGEYRIVRVYTS